MDINEAGIEGWKFSFKQNFLKPRSSKAKLNEILSNAKVQTEGIIQWRVFSPTFFKLKTNKIVTQLPKDDTFQTLFYIIDLQISYRHSDWRTVKRKLKDSINIVEKFAQKSGFKFSISKTSTLHFTKQWSPPSTELQLGNTGNQKSEKIKHLGLVFDSNLGRKAHIHQLKYKCNKALNLLRSVSSTERGADQKTLMMIDRSFC